MFCKFSSLTFVCNLKVIKSPYVMGELIVSDLNSHCIVPTTANQCQVSLLALNRHKNTFPAVLHQINQMCFSLRFVLV